MNPRAAYPAPTPCVTPPACPEGWTRATWDPLCCVGPSGPSGEPGSILCYSIVCPTPTPTPGPAAVPAISGTGLVVAVLLLLAVALWRLR